jgi:hypothetical protein
MGQDVHELRLGDVGLARLILRSAGPLGRIGLIPGGIQWRPDSTESERDAAMTTLPRLLRKTQTAILLCNTISPEDEGHARQCGHIPILTGGYVAELDLTQPEPQRLARAHGKWRNRLAKAQSRGIHLSHTRFSPRRHGWLLQAEADQRRRRGYRALPLGFTSSAAEMAPEQCRLFTATYRGERLGALLFLLHDGAATYHIGHATAPGRAMSVHNHLLWTAANWLAGRGFSRLDLGPIETEISPGLARFKLGSGARPVKRGATCLYTPVTVPLGRLVAKISRTAAHAAEVRNDLSFR